MRVDDVAANHSLRIELYLFSLVLFCYLVVRSADEPIIDDHAMFGICIDTQGGVLGTLRWVESSLW